jgi:hypothetical protein
MLRRRHSRPPDSRRQRIAAAVSFLLFAGMLRVEAQQETAAQAVARALTAQGIQSPNVESISRGKLILFSLKGPKSDYEIAIWRQGNKFQRIIQQGKGEAREGFDGAQYWNTLPGPFRYKEAPARVLRLIESQTTRSVHSLAGAAAASLRDVPETAASRVLDRGRAIEATDSADRKTRYFIDPATSFITRIEFAFGKARDIFGREQTLYETYVLSDFRTVEGQKTPFKI